MQRTLQPITLALLLASGGCRDTLVGPGPAVDLAIAQPAQGARAGAAFDQQPIIRLVDSRGNLAIAATAEVTLTVSLGATVIGTATIPPVNGVVSFSDVGIAGPSGSYTLTYAVVLESETRSVIQTVPLAAGAPAQLVLDPTAAGAEGGLAFARQPVLRIADGSGNFLSEVTGTVTLAVPDGAGIVGSASAEIVNRVATFTDAGIDGPSGTYTLTYSAGLGSSTLTVAQPITVTPGSPVRYVVLASAASAEVGASVALTAQLVDAANMAVARGGRTVDWTHEGATGSFASSTSTTNEGGVATTTFVVDTTLTVGGVTISATDATTLAGSVHVSIDRGPAAKLAFVQQPADTGWRVQMEAVSVRVTDRYGNTIPAAGHPITLSLSPNPGRATLEGGSSTTASNGIATFTGMMVDEPGSGYALRAESGQLAPGTSTLFDISAIAVVVPVVAQTATVRSLAIAGSSLFFLTDGQVWSTTTTGGGSAQRGGFGLGPREQSGRMIYDGTHVDVLIAAGNNLRGGTLNRFQLSGQTGTFNLGPWSVGPDLEFDGTHFYWVFEAWNGSPSLIRGVRRLRVSDGVTDTLVKRVSSLPQPAMTMSEGYLYFTDTLGSSYAIKRMPTDGGAATTVVEVGNISRAGWRTMLVVGSTVYWAESGNGGGAAGSIRSAPVAGGIATTRMSSLTPAVRSMVSDGTYLYVNDGGSLRRYDLATFSATTVVSNDSVTDIALDAEAVYWTSSAAANRTIKKTRR